MGKEKTAEAVKEQVNFISSNENCQYVIGKDKDWRIVQTWQNRLFSKKETLQVLAQLYAVTTYDIEDCLNHYGFGAELPKRKVYKLLKYDEVKELCDKGLTAKEIAVSLGCCANCVRVFAYNHKLEYQKERKCKNIPLDVVKDGIEKGLSADEILELLEDPKPQMYSLIQFIYRKGLRWENESQRIKRNP